MDLATLIGFIGSFAIVVSAMVLGGNPLVFINVPSILIVVIGSAFVVMIKFGIGQFFSAVKIALKTLLFKVPDFEAVIKNAVELADAARKGGLLSLESMEVHEPFLKKGVQLLVDGHEPEVVRNSLSKDMNLALARHTWGQKIFKALGDTSPAMGMIGTLIGLVQMLSTMEDPKTIGPAMAVALLTTLYGAVIATMVALPIADKLSLRSDQEREVKSLVIDALSGIQAGQNPRVIEDALRTYLPSSKRSNADEQNE